MNMRSYPTPTLFFLGSKGMLGRTPIGKGWKAVP
jgi:hypothetical protein